MAGEFVIARPTAAHLRELAATMRAADRLEVESLGYSPLEALEDSLRVSSWSAAALIDGHVAALYGVREGVSSTFLAPVGVAWLLTGAAVDRWPLTFWRASKVVLRGLLERFPRLVNHVDARHLSALSYLRRLGFRVLPAVPFGVRGEPFHPVVFGVA